jgi:Cytochrome bd terminal oxidase subunit I
MSIGLASFLAVSEALWLKTKNPVYLQIHKFWLGIFAMGFGIGVVTEIVLSFEFGLGFAHFAEMAGPAIGPIIALEVLTPFPWKQVFWESCSSASTALVQSCTFSLRAWWRSVRFYRPRGFSRQIAGCRRHLGSQFMMAI